MGRPATDAMAMGRGEAAQVVDMGSVSTCKVVSSTTDRSYLRQALLGYCEEEVIFMIGEVRNTHVSPCPVC